MDEWFYFNLVGGKKKKKLCDWFLQNILHNCLVLKHIEGIEFGKRENEIQRESMCDLSGKSTDVN